MVTPFIGFLGAVAMFWGNGVGIIDIALLVAMYVISGLGIGVGYHRLCAHRSFETPSPLRAVFAIWGSLAAEGPVLFWAAIHPAATISFPTHSTIPIRRTFTDRASKACCSGCGTPTLAGSLSTQ